MSENPAENQTAAPMKIGLVLKIILGSLREYKKPAALALLFGFGEIAGQTTIPFITSQLIDAISENQSMTYLRNLALLLLVISIISLVCGSYSGIFGADAEAGLGKNLRHDMFYAIQNYSHANMDRFSIPSLVTRLTTDTTNVQIAVGWSGLICIKKLFTIILTMIMALKLAGSMAFIYFLIIPFLILVFLVVVKYAMPVFHRMFKRYDKLNLRINENVHGIRTIKSYVREDKECEKLNDAAYKLYLDSRKADRIAGMSFPAISIAIDAVFLFVMYQGSHIIIASQTQDLNVGQFSALIIYGFMIVYGLAEIAMAIVNISMAQEPAKRIAQVLAEVPTIASPEDGITQVSDGSIVFDNVSFKYCPEAENNVLSHISLAIDSGSKVGIIGATGSAKTSLAQLICRLYDPCQGSVIVGGVDAKDYDLDSLRNAVALVEQKNTLFSGTIEENLRWGNKYATDQEIQEAIRIACADEFIEKFPDGLQTEITQGGTNVSGGQKQRLCIARALLKNPKILIFDDSTSAVDTKTDGKIRAGLSKTCPETTQLIIAQRISSVQDCDLIVVMDKGQIASLGTHDELIKSCDIYKETFISQTKKEGGDLDVG